MSHSIYRKIGIASGITMMSIFLSRVIGLAREMVIAYFGGTGASVDAYQVGFIIPEILNHVVASGFLSITFIPIFTRYLSQNRESDGWKAFSEIISVFGCLLLFLVVITSITAPQILQIVGFDDPAVRLEAIKMTRIVIPAQFFFFLGGLFMAVQYAKERFLLPGLAPIVYNLGIITGGVLLSRRLGMAGFAWGALIGAFLGNFLLQLIGAKLVGMRFRFSLNLRSRDLRQYLLLTAPLMVGLTMTFSTEIFAKLFGSYLEEGSVASLNYSLRLMFVLVGIFGQAAGVASYPFLSGLVAKGQMKEVNNLLNTTLKFIIIVIPFAVLMMILRGEIVRIIFQRGNFGSASTELTSNVLVLILIGAVAFAAQTVVTRGYYASQNTIFPSVFGSLAVLVSIPLYVAGMKLFGIYGVALALSISAIIQVGLLYALWNHRTKNSGATAVYLFLLKMVIISIFLGVVFEIIRARLVIWLSIDSVAETVIVAGLVGLVFVISFLICARIMKIDEVAALYSRVKERIVGSRR